MKVYTGTIAASVALSGAAMISFPASAHAVATSFELCAKGGYEVKADFETGSDSAYVPPGQCAKGYIAGGRSFKLVFRTPNFPVIAGWSGKMYHRNGGWTRVDAKSPTNYNLYSGA